MEEESPPAGGEELKKERDEYLDGWKRAKADFVNYKKEEEERMRQIAEYVRRELLVKILPILNNIERALKEIQKPAQSPEGIEAGPPQSSEAGLGGEDRVLKGFLQIASQWREFLKQQGIEAIETVGKPFNPEFHEALSVVEGAEGQKSGTIVEEVEKGYIINGKLLRPAKVIVIK